MSQGQNFLPKFLFVSNLLKAVKIRQRVPNDVVKPAASGGLMHHLRGMHRYTLEMIAMNHFPQAFREVVQAAILDRVMQASLEQEKKLNWCREVKKMVPLRTNGDGNCLLHAASQYMLGVQDTDLVLRKALHGVLKETDTGVFRARFQAELLHSQEFTQTGLRYTTMNWEDEWEKIVKMASPVSSSNGLQFDSLEDIHIFVLSNILRRPIIVIADQVLRSMKSGSTISPLNVGGIYLPLHWPPAECYKYPIVLGYDSQHFAPLITIKDSGPEIRAVPLINPGRGGFEELKVHFLIEKEQQLKERLLKDYLLLIEIPVIGLGYDATRIINAARLDEGNLPEDMNLMEDYLQLVNHEYQRWQEDKEQAWAAQPQRPPPFSVSQLSLIEIRCATPRCTFYVSVDTQPHCHECFEKRQATTGTRIEGLVHTKGGGSDSSEGSSRGGRSSSPPSSSSSRLVVLSSPRSAPPPTAPSLSLYSETHAMKCKTPGCLFTLSVEHDGLCERCFNGRQTQAPPGAGTGPDAIASHTVAAQGPGWNQWGTRGVETERCSMCRQEAFRTFNGLCPPCMQRQQVLEGGESQPVKPRTEASSSAWSQPRDPERPCLTLTPGHASAWQTPLARPCKRSGCQFFGTPEKLGFCTICYVDYQTNHHLTPPPPAPPQSRHAVEAGFQNATRCRGPGCGAVGKAMLEGYCDKCYVKEQSARLNQVTHRTPHSPPPVMRDRATKPRSTQQSQTQTQTQCRRSGCSNVSPGCTDLCPECHTRGQGRDPGRRAQAPKEKSKQRCRTQGCDHYANQEKQGYCNECDHFKQIYRG
ncbi:tumor necrosis factor alpha-induced protein 3 [Corythoichthys intestinalis]|uniref:tumor necrosis factor alpha-induced protein 3 n=1 Tax=Corythoichthys intestinalis TaxID=161448 RepID=UPI0025A608E7|nr:tumor necrosis factor alpha-induced protein 3 [Corythoichthys intestinalis]XP_061794275.1 tumor necrosis factor alpha-induced protein 3-like [Nerophis lumbriciformis]